MNNNSLEQLMRAHSSAKRKLVLGIVFSAVAVFLTYLGIMLASVSEELAAIIVFSLPFYGVGIPFLIIGIIKTKKSNQRINQFKKEKSNENNAVPQPGAQEEFCAAAEPQAVSQTVQPKAQPVNEEPHKEDGAVPFDWAKYTPLNAKISYDPTKEHDFRRCDGFVGSVPQTFINRTLPRCPLCCSNDPYWTLEQYNYLSVTGNCLYFFKCSCCEGVISLSELDVTTLGNGYGGIASDPEAGLMNVIKKKRAGKAATAVYAVIENTGNSGITRECEGKEFKIEDIQDMALRV